MAILIISVNGLPTIFCLQMVFISCLQRQKRKSSMSTWKICYQVWDGAKTETKTTYYYYLLLLTKKCWKLLKCRIRKVNIEFLHKVLKVRRNADCLLKFSELAAGLKCFISQGYNNAPLDAINHLGYPGASASAYSLDLNFFPCIMFLH